MWGVFPEAIYWNIALHTQILICVSVCEVRFKKKKHFQSPISESVFCDPTSDMIYQIKI